ncbi:hypothetical protein GCM10023200_06280 [Actinomycetospora chlora]|uniref:Uncharacterized protein n=1 Tax=Actinomycetospora chlora TaxID=663608 RepID=A0ABP9A949_9PSEU
MSTDKYVRVAEDREEPEMIDLQDGAVEAMLAEAVLQPTVPLAAPADEVPA